MRALLPVAVAAVIVLVVRFAWADVYEAITEVRAGPPRPQPPPLPATPRTPVAEEPVEDDRVFEPNAVLPPPVPPRRPAQYRDPHAPPPARVHPAERVMNTP